MCTALLRYELPTPTTTEVPAAMHVHQLATAAVPLGTVLPFQRNANRPQHAPASAPLGPPQAEPGVVLALWPTYRNEAARRRRLHAWTPASFGLAYGSITLPSLGMEALLTVAFAILIAMMADRRRGVAVDRIGLHVQGALRAADQIDHQRRQRQPKR